MKNFINTKYKIPRLAKVPAPRVLLYIFMIILVCFTSLPIIYVISTAFKPVDELIKFPPQFFVEKPTFDNFNLLLNALDGSVVPFSRNIFNSVYVTLLSVFLTVIVSAMAAYALTKHKVTFGKTLFFLVTVALVFPPQVTQIPNYLIVKNLGLINTYSALIVTKVAVAYNMFLIKQFCEQLPSQFLEAARIDGANEWVIFWKIVMPFLKPACLTLSVFSFVSSWNDYFAPLVYTSKSAMKTVPLALTLVSGQENLALLGITAASAFIMIIPTIIVYLLLQKRVIETVAYSGIK